MWLDAFPPGIPNVQDFVTSMIVAGSAVVSVVVLTRLTASKYDLRGRTSGLWLAVGGLLAYLEATTILSAPIHVLSIGLFYWGCVLYLGGLRPTISTLPAGLVAILAAFPLAPGVAQLVADGSAIGVPAASVILVSVLGRGAKDLGCGYCSEFRSSGDAFCAYCGRLVGGVSSRLPRRKFTGFAIFTVLMLASFTATLPAMASASSISFVNMGLGGPQNGNNLAPFPGWKASLPAVEGNGSVLSYALTQGRASVNAFIAAAQSADAATAALGSARGNTTSGPSLPLPLASEMTSYSLNASGRSYVGVQGVFDVGVINGSSILSTFVAVDLRQSASSFNADGGSALFGAAASVAGWAGSSAAWSPTVEKLLPVYTLFYQAAYLVSISIVVAIAFTLSRDQELARTRRFDALQGLTPAENDILDAFEGGSKRMTGEQVSAKVAVAGPSLISSLKELSRRDLVIPSVVLRDWRPTMMWECKLR